MRYNDFEPMNQPFDYQFHRSTTQKWRPSHLLKRGKHHYSSHKPQLAQTDLFSKTQYKTQFRANSKFFKDMARSTNATPAKKHRQSNEKRNFNSSKSKKRGTLKFQKSPYLSNYISNTTYLQKMMKLLIPVKGPNQSTKLSIKKHNDLNFRNAQLMIVKKQDNFYDRMKAYSARMGLPQDCKIFVMNSKDNHIRQALINHGWKESSDSQSVLFHLKWTYKDEARDYHMLQDGQFFNHFRNNQELTNKNYLRKNIKKYCSSQRPNFPTSFDLDLNEQSISFQDTYLLNEAYSALHLSVQVLKKLNTKRWQKLQSSSIYYRYANNVHIYVEPRQSEMKQILYERQISELKKQSQKWQSLQSFFQTVCFIVESIKEKRKVGYCIFTGGKQPKDKKYNSLKTTKMNLQFGNHSFLRQFSQFYVTEIFKLYHHVHQIVGHCYGFDNMWILKPAGVSRGSGITISSDIFKINQLKHGKIIQKYIQHPLLLNCKRKFDIRQWILVKQFNPLKVYAFKQCYARLSSVKYSNEQYDNLQKHLTNFSQNKQSYSRQKIKIKDHLSLITPLNTNTVLSEEQLSEQIGDWINVKQNILFQIIKTLNCCKLQITQRQQCFQVFGFDVILDQKCKPYILEVNMSPACQKRQFLDQYLTQMSQGLVNMLEGGQPTHWIYLNPDNFEERHKIRQKIALMSKKIVIIQKWWRSLKKEIINNK